MIGYPEKSGKNNNAWRVITPYYFCTTTEIGCNLKVGTSEFNYLKRHNNKVLKIE